MVLVRSSCCFITRLSAPFYCNDKNTHSLYVSLTVSDFFSPVSVVGTNSFEGERQGEFFFKLFVIQNVFWWL